MGDFGEFLYNAIIEISISILLLLLYLLIFFLIALVIFGICWLIVGFFIGMAELISYIYNCCSEQCRQHRQNNRQNRQNSSDVTNPNQQMNIELSSQRQNIPQSTRYTEVSTV